MNIKKIVAGVLVLLAWGAPVQAAPVWLNYYLQGELISYSAIFPNYPNIVSSLEPESSPIIGSISLRMNNDAVLQLSGDITESYHNVNFTDPTNSNRSAVASFPTTEFSFNSWGGLSGPATPINYDPLTRTLSWQGVGKRDVDTSFCVGSFTICAGIYSLGGNKLNWDLTLVFDEDMSNFTGTASYTTTLANGTIISQEYAFASTEDIPLPAAAWLFGSGLIGLAGAVRQRKHRLAAVQ